jgi:hypothetical protein
MNPVSRKYVPPSLTFDLRPSMPANLPLHLTAPAPAPARSCVRLVRGAIVDARAAGERPTLVTINAAPAIDHDEEVARRWATTRH